MMKKIRHALLAGALAAGAASSALAALEVGATAPGFVLPAALAGQPFRFSLADALAKGPVVLYFFPAAFTSGCSAEAHEFAEAMDQFTALGATVIGVSTDDIATQTKFSTQVCAGKFPVAADEGKTVVKSYDAGMLLVPNYANRISYVIAPDGKVLYAYQSLDPSKHVGNTLAALRDWKQAHPAPSSAR